MEEHLLLQSKVVNERNQRRHSLTIAIDVKFYVPAAVSEPRHRANCDIQTLMPLQRARIEQDKLTIVRRLVCTPAKHRWIRKIHKN